MSYSYFFFIIVLILSVIAGYIDYTRIESKNNFCKELGYDKYKETYPNNGLHLNENQELIKCTSSQVSKYNDNEFDIKENISRYIIYEVKE